MRILYFSPAYTTHDHRFLKKLADTRHEVWFLQLQEAPTALEMRPIPHGIRIARWPKSHQRFEENRDFSAMMPDFQHVVDTVQPDLIHAGPVHSCGFMAALLDFHPFMVMSWASDLLLDVEIDAACRWRSEFTLRRADRVICDCQTVRAKARELVDYPDDRIVQFPWGVDLTHFCPEGDGYHYNRRSGWDETQVILSNRSWESVYGVETLLQAFQSAYGMNPALRLVLLGQGSREASIRSMINEHGLHDVVWTPGIVSQNRLPDYLRSADLYVSCAQCDGSSISLLEAMATGLPVVVTDIPGNREWVTAEKNGWLAPEGDSHTFAEMMLRGTGLNKKERAEMSASNLDVAARRADWHQNFSVLLDAYGEITPN